MAASQEGTRVKGRQDAQARRAPSTAVLEPDRGQNRAPVPIPTPGSPVVAQIPANRRSGPVAARHVKPSTVSSLDSDSYASVAVGDVVDRSLAAAAARYTAGLSPAEMAGAFLNWATHLTLAPG